MMQVFYATDGYEVLALFCMLCIFCKPQTKEKR